MIHWVTAFLDIPANSFDATVTFWQTVTGTALSSPRGDDDQFATLIPATGDPYLRVQRTPVDVPPRVHLDFHVDDVTSATDEALALGAVELHRSGHVILASPAGMVFCLVGHDNEAVAPLAHSIGDGPPHRINQVLIDVPNDAYQAEVSFWSALTGWTGVAHEGWDQYLLFEVPSHWPLRLGLQRLDATDASSQARAHIDIGCAQRVDEAVKAHQSIGAQSAGTGPAWVVMTDPAGLSYCLDESAP